MTFSSFQRKIIILKRLRILRLGMHLDFHRIYVFKFFTIYFLLSLVNVLI